PRSGHRAGRRPTSAGWSGLETREKLHPRQAGLYHGKHAETGESADEARRDGHLQIVEVDAIEIGRENAQEETGRHHDRVADRAESFGAQQAVERHSEDEGKDRDDRESHHHPSGVKAHQHGSSFREPPAHPFRASRQDMAQWFRFAYRSDRY